MKAVTTRRPARVRGVLVLGRDGRWRGYVPAIPGLAVAAEAPELAEAALRDAVAEDVTRRTGRRRARPGRGRAGRASRAPSAQTKTAAGGETRPRPFPQTSWSAPSTTQPCLRAARTRRLSAESRTVVRDGHSATHASRARRVVNAKTRPIDTPRLWRRSVYWIAPGPYRCSIPKNLLTFRTPLVQDTANVTARRLHSCATLPSHLCAARIGQRGRFGTVTRTHCTRWPTLDAAGSRSR
jgi:hypothetical protein